MPGNTQGWKQFQTARKQMLDAFDNAIAKDELHKVRTYRGKAAEAEFRIWLSQFLPRKYGVTSGYIISQGQSDEAKTPHYDVIIYEKLEAPILWIDDNPDMSSTGKSQAIPAEYVKAVIEVKSSLTPKSAKEASEHLLELEPLLISVDAKLERYPKFLPVDFFCTTVFFQLKKEYESSKAILDHLMSLAKLRGIFDFLILRGMTSSSLDSGRLRLLHSTEERFSTSKRPTMPITYSALLHEIQISKEYFITMLSQWSQVEFPTFAFDLIALLNGTFDRGYLSSKHGFGGDWKELKT